MESPLFRSLSKRVLCFIILFYDLLPRTEDTSGLNKELQGNDPSPLHDIQNLVYRICEGKYQANQGCEKKLCLCKAKLYKPIQEVWNILKSSCVRKKLLCEKFLLWHSVCGNKS